MAQDGGRRNRGGGGGGGNNDQMDCFTAGAVLGAVKDWSKVGTLPGATQLQIAKAVVHAEKCGSGCKELLPKQGGDTASQETATPQDGSEATPAAPAPATEGSFLDAVFRDIREGARLATQDILGAFKKPPANKK